MSRKSRNRGAFAQPRGKHDPYWEQINSGIQLENSGDLDAARSIYDQILLEAPEHTQANLRLATILNQTGRHDLALDHWVKAFQSGKNDINVVVGYGDCLHELFRFEEAAQLFERAIKLLGSKRIQLTAEVKSRIYLRLGLIYEKLEKYDDSKRCLLRAIAFNSKSADAHNALGYLHTVLGESEDAKAAYRQAIAVQPVSGVAHKYLADEKHHTENDEEVEAMQRLFDSASTPPADKIYIAFGLGKAYDDMGQYAKAFGYWAEGNRLYRKMNPYSASHEFRVMQALQKLYNPEYAAQESVDRSMQVTPVFIVGMVRTGSSLVEQILASHSLVHGAGESDAMNRVIASAANGNLKNLLPLGAEEWRGLGQDYLAELQKGSDGQPYIVDKLLTNYQNIGLIRMMLPHAKIVHCCRDPMAAGLSAFKNIFHPGMQNSSYDLKDIGVLYRKYEKLMRHWEKVFPDWIYAIHYERLVADPEQEVRALLAFLELPFEESCLTYYETKRAIKTVSVAQVRKPIYSSSVESWQNYKNELQPLKKALKGGFFGF